MNILLTIIFSSFLFSMSSWDIQLHNKKSVSIRLASYQLITDYESSMYGGSSLRYISKPINVAIQRWKSSDNIYTNDISISRTFFLDQFNFLNAGFMYWDWSHAQGYYWSGPNRNFWLGYIKKIFLDKSVQLTGNFYANYIDTNLSYWRSSEISLNIIYSIYSFTIEPSINWYKVVGYTTNTSVGLDIRYNYIF